MCFVGTGVVRRGAGKCKRSVEILLEKRKQGKTQMKCAKCLLEYNNKKNIGINKKRNNNIMLCQLFYCIPSVALALLYLCLFAQFPTFHFTFMSAIRCNTDIDKCFHLHTYIQLCYCIYVHTYVCVCMHVCVFYSTCRQW